MEQTTKPDHELARDELRAWWDANASRLPHSLSAPQGVVSPANGPDGKPWLCIAYTLTIKGHAFVMKYGIGHVPEKAVAKWLKTPWGKADRANVVSTYQRKPLAQFKDPTHNQLLVDAMAYIARNCDICHPSDIIGCTARDGQEAYNTSFEEWASNLGFDTDSRKAEDIYRQCADGYRKLLVLGLTPKEISDLADMHARL